MMSILSIVVLVFFVGLLVLVAGAIVTLIFFRGNGATAVAIGVCVVGLLVLLGLAGIVTLGWTYRRAEAVRRQAVEVEYQMRQSAQAEARRSQVEILEAEEVIDKMVHPPQEGSKVAPGNVPAKPVPAPSPPTPPPAKPVGPQDSARSETESETEREAPRPPASSQTNREDGTTPVDARRADSEGGAQESSAAQSPDEGPGVSEAAATEGAEPQDAGTVEALKLQQRTNSTDGSDIEPVEDAEDKSSAASDQDTGADNDRSANEQIVDELTAQQANAESTTPDGPVATDGLPEGSFVSIQQMPGTVTDHRAEIEDAAAIDRAVASLGHLGEASSSMGPATAAPPSDADSFSRDSKISNDVDWQPPARPEWTKNPPDRIDGHYAAVVYSDPFETRILCDMDLERRARSAIIEYGKKYARARGFGSMPSRFPVTEQDIEAITREKFYTLRGTSLGEMTVGYQLLVFDDAVHAKLEQRIQDAVVDQRIAWAGMISGGALAMLTSVFGVCHLLTRKSQDPLSA